ncbi:MFS transporter [Marinivivus vitaminiproducens]|uniref:MFS transporter n=1 Tax=Marinivivus vitaminiproducens TaxID=3035935 RepID=UPI0027A4EED2|nr:MFS transporter [Geminicoccaceae bacterium SCSIO 64248]
MIAPSTVWRIGVSQLVCWGVSYYLIGAFAPAMIADLGWSPAVIHGGYSAGLLVMGLSSPVIGRLVERHGGRPVMSVGSVLTALGCAGLAVAETRAVYYVAWIVLGLAMRCTLYDAAFAALARIGGAAARRPISQITLLGGLASTVFWPIGYALAEIVGWRHALFCYAGFALLTLPLHLAIPGTRAEPREISSVPGTGSAPAPTPDKTLAAALYALIVMATSLLNSAMSAHMIGILHGLGVAAATSVWIATLRGVGQSGARLAEVMFGRRIGPLDLNVLATSILPIGFVAGLFGGVLGPAAIGFAFVYGAGNGLATITRGTLPLVLFHPRTYGSLVGWLITPSFFLAAAAPLGYALVIERWGPAAALHLSLAVALLTVAAALVLRLRFGPSRP